MYVCVSKCVRGTFVLLGCHFVTHKLDDVNPLLVEMY